MRVELDNGDVIDLGRVEAAPTISIRDFSKRTTDDFGVTTVVPRGFSRRMSVRLAVPFEDVDRHQREFAALRATPARWVADDRWASLAFRGFYQDFELDVATKPFSRCTLTVEGLVDASDLVDDGREAAAQGTSTFAVLDPIEVTDAVLVSSSVADTAYPAWGAGTTYAKGARVLRAHRAWESLADANVANDPAGNAGKWLDLGATNRWSMFDQALGSTTEADTQIVTVLQPAMAVDGLAVLDTNAGSVRVQADAYDQTRIRSTSDTASTFLFDDLTVAAGAQVTVTVYSTGATRQPRDWDDRQTWSDASAWADTTPGGAGGTVSVGTLLLGNMRGLGVTEASPTAGITDYSKKDTDDFGEVTVVERAWAQRMSARTLIRNDAVDIVANRIAAVRARPVLWIGQRGIESLTVYGFFKDFSVEIGETTAKLSLSIEGLSRAAPIVLPEPALVPRGDYDPAEIYYRNNIVQFAGSSWIYIATTSSSGNAPPTLPTRYNDWWRVFAQAGTDGDDGTSGGAGLPGTNGQSIHIAYADSPDGTVNFTTGEIGSRSYIGVYTDTDAGADSTNPADYGWTLLKGQNGANGLPGPGGYVHLAYANSADGSADFHVSDPTGRAYLGAYTDQTQADSTDYHAYTWSRIKGEQGENGLNGAQGIPGPPGNGAASFIHLAYADSADGSVNFTIGDAGSRGYIGIYTDASEPDSTDYHAYTWSKWAGRDGTNGVPGAAGANGQTPYTHFAYSNASNGSVDFHISDPTGRGWLGVYADYTPADSENPALYTWSLIKGANGAAGANGTPGPPGANGQATYVHTAYANSPDGSANFSTTDGAGRTYLGTYTDGILADSESPAAYTWSLIKGADGATGSPGTPGATGATGPAGPPGRDGTSADQAGMGLLTDGSANVSIPSSGNNSFVIANAGITVVAGRKFRITLAGRNPFYNNGDNIAVAQIDIVLTYAGGSSVTLFSGTASVNYDGSLEDSLLVAASAQPITNPSGGSATFTIRYQRVGPIGNSASFTLSWTLERI